MKSAMWRIFLLTVCAVSLMLSAAACTSTETADTGIYSDAIAKLETYIQKELEIGDLKGVTVALVDDQKVIWSKGFGMADVEKGIPADADTVYRVGSISKLFTDLGIMQQVEKGNINIDAPLKTYLPDFEIENPFDSDKEVTLRNMMSHFSGLPREAPVGSYFDDTEPSIEDTVKSVYTTRMIYPPETRTKYSNAAVTMVGYVLSLVTGQDYVEYQNENILDPLGMTSSDFLPNDIIRGHLATSYMWVAGKGEIESPLFELGTIPAGNLYSTVGDLAKFMSCVFNGGEFNGTRIIGEDALNEMLTRQFDAPEHRRRFGIGFVVGEFRGHPTFGHTGAVFGFTSDFVALSDEKIGAIVLANEDIATGPVLRISRKALNLMLEAKNGEPLPEEPNFVELEGDEWKTILGKYESEVYWAKVIEEDGQPAFILGGQKMRMEPLGPFNYIASNRLVTSSPLTFDVDEESGKVTNMTFGLPFTRTPEEPRDYPKHWDKYVGKYGKEFIPVIISIRDGRLYAFLENEYDYLLTPVSETVFDMPKYGMYQDQQIEFVLAPDGSVEKIIMAFVEFEPIEE